MALMAVLPIVIIINPDSQFNVGKIILTTATEAFCALILLGFNNPLKFWWAWRGVGALVFSAYVIYLIAMLIESGGRFTIGEGKSETTVLNALMGLIVFGIPGLAYAIFGRLTFRKPIGSDEPDWDDMEADFDNDMYSSEQAQHGASSDAAARRE